MNIANLTFRNVQCLDSFKTLNSNVSAILACATTHWTLWRSLFKGAMHYNIIKIEAAAKQVLPGL
jgi:hypothetical protein